MRAPSPAGEALARPSALLVYFLCMIEVMDRESVLSLLVAIRLSFVQWKAVEMEGLVACAW